MLNKKFWSSINSIKKINEKFDICKNFLVVSPDFTCFATKWEYRIKGILKCDSRYVIYFISCKCCGKQYVESATDFKQRFRIHKSDINTGQIRCCVGTIFLMFLALLLVNLSYASTVHRKSFCSQWWRYWQFCGKENNTGKSNYLR